MNKNIITILFLSFAINFFAQNEELIIETDSIKIFDTFLSNNTLNNLSPTFYKNGVLYTSSHNSNKFGLYFSDLKSKIHPIKVNTRFHLGKVAVYNNEIYFTGNSNRVDANSEYKLKIYKGILKEYKITKVKLLDICKNPYNYGHPSISKDGNTMVITTNERGQFHLQILKRNASNKWIKQEVAFIVPRNFTLINPTLFDNNTIYFSSNMKDGNLKRVISKNVDGKLVVGDLIYEEDSFNIYKIEKIGTSWSLPKKINVLNSEFDDLDVLFINKKSGYLTTSRFDNNDNIFYFELKH